MATSMPELVVTVTAGLRGATDIGIGNVVGSNIANILLILGLAALLCPIEREPRRILRDTICMVGATAVFILLACVQVLTFVHGVLMILLMVAYLVMSYVIERRGGNDTATGLEAIEEAGATPKTAWVAAALVAVVISAVAGGSVLLVRGATTIARAAGISETVIGLTLVAVGTSLPELATSVVAAFRRHGDVALGNVIGSNIFNILGILGVTALYRQFRVPAEIGRLDIWVMLLAAVVVIVFSWTRAKIERWEGAMLLVGYAVYLTVVLSPPLRAGLRLP
jgi:cation:H+ antiporter